MESTTASALDGDDKAALILEAAVKVFSRHGLAGARVDDIARAAGVGKGTIYEYFTSKDELFERMILFAADVQVAAVAKALVDGTTLQASLEGALLASLNLVESHQALVRVVMDNVTGGPSRELREAMFQRQQRLIAAIKDAFQRHSKPPAGEAGQTDGADQFRPAASLDVALAAHMFLGVLQTLSVARLLQQDPSSLTDSALDRPAAQLAAGATDLFLRGLG